MSLTSLACIRSPATNPWNKNRNPITQKSLAVPTPNGVNASTKAASSPRAMPAQFKDSKTPEQTAKDKLDFVLSNFQVSWYSLCAILAFRLRVCLSGVSLVNSGPFC